MYIGPLTTTMATDVETTGSMTTGDVVKSPVTTTQDHTTHTSTNSTLPPTPTETAPLGKSVNISVYVMHPTLREVIHDYE